MQENRSRARWFEYRLPEWRRVATELDAVEHGKSSPAQTVLDLVRAYPELARDTAIARREASGAPLTRYLEGIYLRLHRSLFRPPGNLRANVAALFTRDAAKVAQDLRGHILYVVLLFACAVAVGALLVASYPELVSLFASEQMIEQVSRGELWTDNLLNVFPSSLLAVQIFTNNIVVALSAVCLGVLYGLGTIYIIGMNGLMLGGIFSFTARHGMAGRLFEFACAHGFVELSVICVAGAVGASLGEALARPGQLTRAAAFHAATVRGAKLMLVCIAFLVGAGMIEGFVSPDPRYPLEVRLIIGLSYLALFVFVLSGRAESLKNKIRAREGAPTARGRAV